jgi:hypothetical protein
MKKTKWFLSCISRINLKNEMRVKKGKAGSLEDIVYNIHCHAKERAT